MSDSEELPTTAQEWAYQAKRNRYTELHLTKDNKPGSDWDYGKLREFPPFLKEYMTEAEKRLNGSAAFGDVLTLLKNKRENWQDLNYLDLLDKGGVFGRFFCLLAELLEVEPKLITEPPRQSGRNKNKTVEATSTRPTHNAPVRD